MDTMVCIYADECDDETCLHHEPHEEGPGCRHSCCGYTQATDAVCKLAEVDKVVVPLATRKKVA